PRRFFRPPRPPGPPVPPSGPTDLHELGWQARLALGREVLDQAATLPHPRLREAGIGAAVEILGSVRAG
ncbi:hypothetical protein, partial [Falsiroseomonas oryzae]|uniref:hypothetical protein n=1 Tax=Falsiroseomonas oryzae TaxID=2766473 RepID=UPI0022EA8744